MDDLTLYIICRTDLESMKFGKAAAQCAHAANQFTDAHVIRPLMADLDPAEDVLAWRAQAGTFGTTFTLAAPSLRNMADTVAAADVLGYRTGLVVDPTYPFLVPNEMVGRLNSSLFTAPPMPVGREKTLCFIEETTTAYVFGSKRSLEVLLGKYQPLPNE